MKRLSKIVIVGGMFCLLLLATRAADTPEGKDLGHSPQAVRIASQKQALVPIVIAPAASAAIRETAGALQAFLGRITGAEFVISTNAAPGGITVGTLEQFPSAELVAPLKRREDYDGVEAFVIRSDMGLIRLLGSTDLGASHAVYRFLELLGCRWFFMGPTWEVVPQIPDLSFALNESARPDIWSRQFSFTRMRIPAEDGDPDRVAAFDQWKRANRMAQSLDFRANHVWHAIPNAFKMAGYPFKAEFESHPEYFALVNGKRTPPQLCVANAGLQELIVRYSQQYFELNPDHDMVSLDTADTSGWCTCPECQQIGSHPAQPFYLANIAARALQKTHPGKYVGLLAYSWHSDPPDFKLEPNVFVQLTAGMNASRYSFDELFDLWTTKCQRVGIYEYFTYWEMDKCMLPGKGPQNRIDELPARLKRYVDHNVVAISAEAANSWGAHGLGYYLSNKLMWNTTADLEALKQDFFEKAFGPAAIPMARYFERLDLSHHPFLGIALYRDSLNDLLEAETLAATRLDVMARLDALKSHMVYTYLGHTVDANGNAEKQEEQALDWFTWAYRTRNTYMHDWITFRAAVGNNTYAPTLAAKFDKPSWNYRHTKDNPWRDDRPVTHAELNRRLAAIQSEWGKVDIEPAKTFSDRYVLVKSAQTGTADYKLAIINQATLLLASRQGEPLRFTLFSSPSPKLERQLAKFWLTTVDGKAIEQGELPEGENLVELKVPGPGVYRFTCKRGGGGWWAEFSEDQPSAILVERERDVRPQYRASYFYVPKGTPRVTLHVQWGSASVLDPEGHEIYKGQPGGDFMTFAVKPGTDGRVWSILGKHRNLWFMNIPTVLSTDPQAIFVPQELAEADGLEIIIP